MLAYFFRQGLIVVINSADSKANEDRAVEIAGQQYRQAGLTEEPSLSGVATLPEGGVIVAWHDIPEPGNGITEDAVRRIVEDEVGKAREDFEAYTDREIVRLEEQIDKL